MNAGKSAPSSAWETGSRKPRRRRFTFLPAYEGRGVVLRTGGIITLVAAVARGENLDVFLTFMIPSTSANR
jgi:hypothetical protein